ncbi:MAG: glycosyltransferase family A protein [Vicinamibacterales bacterium]
MSIGGTERLTVIIPSYHVKRARNLEPLVRACLRCSFVERVVVSNHNPKLRLVDWISVDDPRLQLLEEGRRHGCGHAWTIAAQLDADYFFVIDDDQLLNASQLARLFRALVADPEVPHGLCGERHGQYLERRAAEVDVLYNVYAVTRAHVDAFHARARELQASRHIRADEIEYFADDIIVSRCGNGLARIHDAGFVLRCRTGNQPGVAIFKEAGFADVRARVSAALDA